MGNVFKLFFLCFLSATYTQAQIAVGLKESALGNSGAAITESSAPSFYNPALLSERNKSYFSLTGTTLTSFKSSTENQDFNSTKFAPNYLSSINAFESYIHEFALINQVSIDTNSTAQITNGSRTSHLTTEQYILSYAFAFRNFPFGFQLGLHMNEQNVSLNQITSDANAANGVTINNSQTAASLFLGFGGIHQLGSNYRFGYKYEAPRLRVYKKTTQSGSYYNYDKVNDLFYTGRPDFISQDTNYNSQVITLGHSFSLNDHEFLTDSRMTEDSERKDTYTLHQTFGYKVNFSNKMQFMCGFSHQFGTGSPKLSESGYFSSGFSWQTNTLRSTVSGYYMQGDSDSEIAGLTFGSEFVY